MKQKAQKVVQIEQGQKNILTFTEIYLKMQYFTRYYIHTDQIIVEEKILQFRI